ncbi:MAG: hypothetical protein JXA83_05915 [Acidimicrobiales bacterium]|nr:hypothetical protein [Acidimicrobiales bacterium]
MAKRPARWLAAVLCALTITAAGSCHKPPSAETRSYYMGRAGVNDAALLGCFNADKSGRLTLFFGAPTTVGGSYGATLWGARDLTVSQIGERIKSVVRGFAYCRQNSSHRLLIGVGTSNSAIDGRSDAWLRAHGAAWARGVRDVAAWADANFPGHAQIYAAWDFEPSWSTYGKAEMWMRGYDTTSGRRLLFANASADGCPTASASNGPCNNGWNQHRVWHLAWEHDPSLPIPQIYTTSGNQARQWQLIDLWSTTAVGDGMYFYGSMTQWGACQQVGGCAGVDNTPHQGNDQLRNWLNSDSRTAQGDVPTMTDMNWNS